MDIGVLGKASSDCWTRVLETGNHPWNSGVGHSNTELLYVFWNGTWMIMSNHVKIGNLVFVLYEAKLHLEAGNRPLQVDWTGNCSGSLRTARRATALRDWQSFN